MKREIEGKLYYEDARGGLVPEESIKPIDLIRDDLVTEIMGNVLLLREDMKHIKADSMRRIEEFVNLSAAKYGVKLGSSTGRITLRSFDGSMKVEIGISESLDVTESIHAAKQLIDEYLIEITKDSGADLKMLVTRAFRVKQGRMDVKRILELKTYNISDPRWVKAMEIISDSIKVTATTKSMRLYKRIKDDRYQLVALDFNTL